MLFVADVDIWKIREEGQVDKLMGPDNRMGPIRIVRSTTWQK